MTSAGLRDGNFILRPDVIVNHILLKCSDQGYHRRTQPKKVVFLSSPIKVNIQLFPLTDAPAIPNKFISKEAENSPWARLRFLIY